MFTGELLPYQREAVDKMVKRGKVLVAYDLGLGKTVITIAAVESLRDLAQVSGPVLVVALSSLKYQWAKEIAAFSDQTSIVIDGGPAKRQEQYAQAPQYGYMIVNYEQIVNDWPQVSALFPVYKSSLVLVFDEVTAIKSFRSKRSKKSKELAARFGRRFALTGTPMENGRPEELYSIMQAVDKDVFGKRFDLFDQTFIVRNKFGGVERYRNLDTLHQRLSTACVRKTQRDPDVAPFLPETIERDPVLVSLDKNGQLLYDVISTDLLEDLEQAREMFGDSFTVGFNVDSHYGMDNAYDSQMNAWKGRIMSKIVALRQLCDDPKLLVSSGLYFDPYKPGSGSEYLSELFGDREELLKVARAAKPVKMPVLESIVKDHLSVDDEHKVVVFTTYLDVATVLHNRLGGVVYNGTMSAREKESAKERFQADPDVRVFVSTDAGGYGVDLPQANLLINYDLPWSSGTATQRNGRIRRASSKWPSIVIQSILVDQSIELRQFQMIAHKSLVQSAVVDGKGFDPRGGVDMSVASLAESLRLGFVRP